MQSQLSTERLSATLGDVRRQLWYSIRERVMRAGWLLVYWTTGRRLSVTVNYRDSTSVSGEFDADATVARRLVPSTLDVIESTPGRTTASITVFTHHDVDVSAPYTEVVISVPVRYVEEEGSEGLYPISLPVSTEEARWAGVVTAGFPKFIADITLDETPEGMTGTATADGQQILTLEVDRLETAPSSEHVRLYALRDDGHLTESLSEETRTSGSSDEPGGARLELGTHPLADVLRALDLGRESVAHTFAPDMRIHLRCPAVDHGPAVESEADSSSPLARVLRPR